MVDATQHDGVGWVGNDDGVGWVGGWVGCLYVFITFFLCPASSFPLSWNFHPRLARELLIFYCILFKCQAFAASHHQGGYGVSFGWGSGLRGKGFGCSSGDGIRMAFTTRKDCLSVVVRSSRVVQDKKVFKHIVRICMDPPTCLSLNVSTCKKRELYIWTSSGFLYPTKIYRKILTNLGAWAFSTCGKLQENDVLSQLKFSKGEVPFFQCAPWIFQGDYFEKYWKICLVTRYLSQSIWNIWTAYVQLFVSFVSLIQPLNMTKVGERSEKMPRSLRGKPSQPSIKSPFFF